MGVDPLGDIKLRIVRFIYVHVNSLEDVLLRHDVVYCDQKVKLISSFVIRRGPNATVLPL